MGNKGRTRTILPATIEAGTAWVDRSWAYFAQPWASFVMVTIKSRSFCRSGGGFALPAVPAGRSIPTMIDGKIRDRPLRGIPPGSGTPGPVRAQRRGRAGGPSCGVLIVLGGLSLRLALAADAPVEKAKDSAANSTAACLDCHSDPKGSMKKAGHSVSLFADPAVLGKSAHRSLECTDCHEGFDAKSLPHRQPLTPVNCASCHDDAGRRHVFHARLGQSPAAGGEDTACTACHGTHAVATREVARIPVCPEPAGRRLRPVPPAGPRPVPGLGSRPCAGRRDGRCAGLSGLSPPAGGPRSGRQAADRTQAGPDEPLRILPRQEIRGRRPDPHGREVCVLVRQERARRGAAAGPGGGRQLRGLPRQPRDEPGDGRRFARQQAADLPRPARAATRARRPSTTSASTPSPCARATSIRRSAPTAMGSTTSSPTPTRHRRFTRATCPRRFAPRAMPRAGWRRNTAWPPTRSRPSPTAITASRRAAAPPRWSTAPAATARTRSNLRSIRLPRCTRPISWPPAGSATLAPTSGSPSAASTSVPSSARTARSSTGSPTSTSC